LIAAALLGCDGGAPAGKDPTTDPTGPVHSASTDSTSIEPTGVSHVHSGSANHTAEAPPPVVFVLQGDRGRLAVSCDDGRTWPVDASDDDTFRCFVDGDCDHDPGAGRGITFGDDAFVATFGWGFPGSIRRLGSGEAVFSEVLGGHTFAGVFYDDGVFLAAERPPYRSTDGGATFGAAGDVQSAQWNTRRTGGGEGLFLVAFDSGASDLNVSDDGGVTFRRPTTWPAACGRSLQWEGGLAVQGGVALVVGGDGVACRSTDSGDTWVEVQLGGSVSGRLVVTGTAFETWGEVGGQPVRFRSSDGAAWTTDPLTVNLAAGGTASGPTVGAVARGPNGTYVAVNGGWDQWYERQRFYRSTDGVTWDELAAGAFTGGHPVRFAAAGAVDVGTCP
jgi:hypothetical protein